MMAMVRAAGLMLIGAALWATAAPAQPMVDRLHSDLQLSAAQEEGWKAFEQAYRVDPQTMAQERDAEARMPGLTGPERIDLAIRMAQQGLLDMRRRGDALKTFYAGLSPQQQKVFDRDTLSAGPGR